MRLPRVVLRSTAGWPASSGYRLCTDPGEGYTQSGDVFLNLHPDRLEVVNTGRLPLGVTPQNILHASRRRNDGLARVFHDLKLMEREGSGFDLMYDRLLASGRSVPSVVASSFSNGMVDLPNIECIMHAMWSRMSAVVPCTTGGLLVLVCSFAVVNGCKRSGNRGRASGFATVPAKPTADLNNLCDDGKKEALDIACYVGGAAAALPRECDARKVTMGCPSLQPPGFALMTCRGAAPKNPHHDAWIAWKSGPFVGVPSLDPNSDIEVEGVVMSRFYPSRAALAATVGALRSRLRGLGCSVDEDRPNRMGKQVHYSLEARCKRLEIKAFGTSYPHLSTPHRRHTLSLLVGTPALRDCIEAGKSRRQRKRLPAPPK